MTIPQSRIAILLVVGGLSLSGCGSSGNDDGPLAIEPPPQAAPPAPEPPPAGQSVDFTAFVGDQFAMTADDSDPQPVDDIEFEFSDQDEPEAFDDLLQGF